MTLVGWWPLHDDSAQDLSGNDNHGTLNGGVTTGTAGRGGLEAMSFNGSDGYVQTSYSRPDSDSYTLSCWVKLETHDTGNNYTHFVSDDDESNHVGIGHIDNSGVIVSAIDNGTNYEAGPHQINTNEWTLVTGVFNSPSGELSLYINGEHIESVSGSWGISTNQYQIGNSPPYPNYHQGELFDARVYSRALSQSEIQTLYEWGSADLAQPPTDGVARYALDGDATDSWGSNDGTNNGVTFTNDAIRGQAGEFESANNDYIDIGDFSSISDSITVSMWVYPRSQNQQSFIHLGPSSDGTTGEYGSKLTYNGNNNFWRFTVRDSSAGFHRINGNTLNTNQWYHLVGVYDNSNGEFRAYENGKQIDTVSDSFTPYFESGPSTIGRRPIANDRYVDGNIDDVRIYDYALSPAEVFELYQWGTKGRDMRKHLVNRRQK